MVKQIKLNKLKIIGIAGYEIKIQYLKYKLI